MDYLSESTYKTYGKSIGEVFTCLRNLLEVGSSQIDFPHVYLFYLRKVWLARNQFSTVEKYYKGFGRSRFNENRLHIIDTKVNNFFFSIFLIIYLTKLWTNLLMSRTAIPQTLMDQNFEERGRTLDYGGCS